MCIGGLHVLSVVLIGNFGTRSQDRGYPLMMDISVIIPTYHRSDKLCDCLKGLINQSMDGDRFEVLVGIDGGKNEPDRAAALTDRLRALWTDAFQDHLHIVACEKIGQGAVRNELLDRATGTLMVSLNDDVLPQPDLLDEHWLAYTQAQKDDRVVIVAGSSPYVIYQPDRVFDLLIRQSPMVFFEHTMKQALASGQVDDDHDWGFRHACGLNFSAPMRCCKHIGGFPVYPVTYGYEDIEYVYRLTTTFDAPVVYRPHAAAPHNHRHDPKTYLDREYTLGKAAWGFATISPECAKATFGRNMTEPEELEYAKAFVEHEEGSANAIRETFLSLAEIPRETLPPDGHPALPYIVGCLYEHHLLLKRWMWRKGFLDGARMHQEQQQPSASIHT